MRIVNAGHTARTLAIGTHPEDIMFGCGGTLMRLDQQGHQIFVLTGETSADVGDQLHVARSFAMLGTGALSGENWLFAEHSLVHSMKSVVTEINPTMVFVQYPEDLIPEHKCFARCAISATRFVRNVFFYELPTSQDFTPSIFVDIESVLSDKARLLESRKPQAESQRVGEQDMHESELITSLAHFRGLRTGVKAAEGFSPHHMILDLCAQTPTEFDQQVGLMRAST